MDRNFIFFGNLEIRKNSIAAAYPRRWVQNKTYPMEEIAIRFKHKLVWIHLFVNGNGRHSRLVADLFLELNGEKPFSWGRENLTEESPYRKTYIQALQIADKSEKYEPLIKFARS